MREATELYTVAWAKTLRAQQQKAALLDRMRDVEEYSQETGDAETADAVETSAIQRWLDGHTRLGTTSSCGFRPKTAPATGMHDFGSDWNYVTSIVEPDAAANTSVRFAPGMPRARSVQRLRSPPASPTRRSIATTPITPGMRRPSSHALQSPAVDPSSPEAVPVDNSPGLYRADPATVLPPKMLPFILREARLGDVAKNVLQRIYLLLDTKGTGHVLLRDFVAASALLICGPMETLLTTAFKVRIDTNLHMQCS